MSEERPHSRTSRAAERYSFRPTLEVLESRLVPSPADVSAAFNRLSTNLGNLNASLAAHDSNGVNANFSLVASDTITLKFGAAAFTVGDRRCRLTAEVRDQKSEVRKCFADL